MFGSGFISPSLFKREEHIQVARRESQRNLRDLRRDREDLERRERQQMAQLKSLVKKGDFPKANLLARQIALYRNLADKNFERGISIQTEVQMMLSNQKINRAHAESIKGLRHGNSGNTIEIVRQREQKYESRMEEYETIESIMNEGFDDIYEHVTLRKDQPNRFDDQVEGVFREALDPKTKMCRDHAIQNTPNGKVIFSTLQSNIYFAGMSKLNQQLKLCFWYSIHLLFSMHLNKFIKILNGRVFLHVKNFNQFMTQSISTATVFLPSLTISGDILKQCIMQDRKALRALHLFEATEHGEVICDFQVGELVKFFGDFSNRQSMDVNDEDQEPIATTSHNTSYKFVSLDLTQTLESLGLVNAGIIWVYSPTK
ncbi:hypothetical protein BDV3_005728 [Batrachochytrium dendrobatidis]